MELYLSWLPTVICVSVRLLSLTFFFLVEADSTTMPGKVKAYELQSK
jgi:hypothetical protein